MPAPESVGSDLQGEFAHRATDGEMSESLLTRVVFPHVTETSPPVPHPPRHIDGKEVEGRSGFEADFEIALPLREWQNGRVHGEGAARRLATEPEPHRRIKSEEGRSNANRESQIANPRTRAVSTITPHIEIMDRHLGPEIDALHQAHRSGQENRAGQEIARREKILTVTILVEKAEGPLTKYRDLGPAAAGREAGDRSAL